MAYSTQDDILLQIDNDTLVNLTDDANVGSINVAIITRAIDDADALINNYISNVASVDVVPTAPTLRMLSVDLAIYNLYSRRNDTIPEIRVNRFNADILMLQKIIDNKLNVTGVDIVSGIATNTDPADRIFTTGKKSSGSIGSLDDY